jgi:hypothetical protein
MHRPRGSRRDQRPARHHGLRDVLVAPQAGMPVLMQPRSGQRSAAHAVGQRSTDPLAPLPSTSGTTCLGADSARSSAEHLQQLAAPRAQWRPRVPAPWRAAQAVWAQAEPPSLAPLMAA